MQAAVVDVGARYDALAATYDRPNYDPRSALYWEIVERLTWELSAPFLPAPGVDAPVLDAGGGTGKWALRFAELGHHVSLLDVSAGMLEAAREKVNATPRRDQVSLHRGTIESLPFSDATFAFTFCDGDPLSYCHTTYRGALRELVRVTRPGAFLVIGVDNAAITASDLVVAAALREFQGTGTARCPYGMPVHAFTPVEVSELARSVSCSLAGLYGKPLFWSRVSAVLARMAGERPPRAWADSIVAEQLWLNHAGYGSAGDHLHIVLRKG